MEIIIDLTSLFLSNFITGVQRVALEYATRIVKEKRCILIFYKQGDKQFYLIDNNVFLINAKEKKKLLESVSKKKFSYYNLNENYIWLDIDAVWSSECKKRNYIYPHLKKRHVKIITMVHDLFPITIPCCVNDISTLEFLIYISSVFDFADLVLTISNVCKEQIIKYLKLCKKSIEVNYIHHGCDFKNIPFKPTKKIVELSKHKYILMVGTIEPRKNYNFVVEAFSKYFFDKDISLIIVGRLGWDYEPLLNFIKNLKNKKIILLNNCSDNDLSFLYKNAYLFVSASKAEGFGIPVIEAIYYNCPVITSDLPIYKEITNNLCITFKNADIKDFYCKVKGMLDDKKRYFDYKNNLKRIKIMKWDDSYKKLNAILDNFLYNKNSNGANRHKSRNC